MVDDNEENVKGLFSTEEWHEINFDLRYLCEPEQIAHQQDIIAIHRRCLSEPDAVAAEMRAEGESEEAIASMRNTPREFREHKIALAEYIIARIGAALKGGRP